MAPGGKTKGTAGTPGAEAFKPPLTAEPAAAAFTPGGRGSHDNGGLSTKREAEHPEAAYWAYLHAADPPGSRWALGTWGFEVGEAESLELPSFDDGGFDAERPQHHATVWFPMPEELSRRELKLLHDRLAEELRKFALGHGCLHRPEDPLTDAASLRTS
ncbi:hypothetical protein NWT09_13175 [Mycolicibacterium sp. jd]|uniref:hypothetical protein n=1 Tax=unclassified Mycolicibacterium TaxID=2636767 RepID=UPI00351B8927